MATSGDFYLAIDSRLGHVFRVGDHDEVPALAVRPAGSLEGDGEGLTHQSQVDRTLEIEAFANRPRGGQELFGGEWQQGHEQRLTCRPEALGTRGAGNVAQNADAVVLGVLSLLRYLLGTGSCIEVSCRLGFADGSGRDWHQGHFTL